VPTARPAIFLPAVAATAAVEVAVPSPPVERQPWASWEISAPFMDV